ncbi:MAG: histidinol-phosphatase [Verrucomicrobiota bacterium]
MSPTAIYFDSHMHTPLCKHAIGQPEEYALTGIDRGLKGIIMTCHSPMPDRFSHAVRMSPDQFDEYIALVARATDRYAGSFEVKVGMESDWFPGMEPWLEELHGRADFHYILGSVHYHIPEYRAAYWKEEPLPFQEGYFRHLAEAAESGLFDSISHPDLVKNMFPDTWDFEEVRPVVAEALDRIREAEVAMEINTSGLNKKVPEMNPGPLMLEMMADRQIPVVIGSDAHHPHRVGADFGLACENLAEAGYREIAYFHERQRVDLPIDEVAASLAGY